MNEMVFEVMIIALLLFANGLFAMTEIAVVSARKARLRQLADAGNAGARTALDLAESPSRFLSTVQVGITLVSVFTGAYGGATLAEELAGVLKRVAWIEPYAEPVALGLVVVVIAYFTLVIGELVPKRLALNSPETIACWMARPVNALARMANPIVTVLTQSTEALLSLFGLKTNTSPSVTEEEVKMMVREGFKAGVLYKTESELVESVLSLDQLTSRDLMTPRAKIIWLNLTDSHTDIWHKIVVSGHTHFPVYQNHRDNVVGIVSVKAIYANLAAGAPVNLKDLMLPPLVVPASQMAIQLLETFKQTGKHIALVADEFGGIVGLVTLHDAMEAIVGDFPSPDERAKPAAKKREDGTWLIDAMIEIESLDQTLPGFQFDPPGQRDYQTLAGFIVKHLGRVPKEGEIFQTQGYTFEIIDMDRHRVDKVLVMRGSPPSAPSAPASSTNPTPSA